MLQVPKSSFVYILSNDRRTVLYTGSTEDLKLRVAQHRSGATRGFTAKYNATTLIYYERFDSIEDARAREKAIKKMNRSKKEALIVSKNPHLSDILGEI